MIVQGFEISEGLAKKLTDDTDDAPDAALTIAQLKEIANEYFSMFSSEDGHQHWIIENEGFQIEL